MDCTEDRGAKEKMKPEEVFEWANAVAPKVRDYVGYAFERNMGQMAAALAEAEAMEPGAALPVTLRAKLGPGQRFSIEALTWDVKSRRVDKNFWELDLDTSRPMLPGLDEAIAEAEREEKARQDADWIVRLRKRQDSFLERMGADCMKVGVAQNGNGKVLRVLDGEGSRLAAVPDVEEALALIDEQENGLAARERPDGLLELLPNSLSRIGEDVGVIRVCLSEEAAMRFLADGGAAWPAIVDIEEAHHEA